jgi:hypothetical protein
VSALDEWLKSGAYLPDVLRDFHDQKDVFKAMHEAINVEKHDYAKSVDWITGQCYVIDVFLWFMARRGYTLQRSRAKQEFVSLPDTLRAAEARQTEAFQQLFERDAAKGSGDE